MNPFPCPFCLSVVSCCMLHPRRLASTGIPHCQRRSCPAPLPCRNASLPHAQPLFARLSARRHGTGHGVGAALNVHEGPQSISTR